MKSYFGKKLLNNKKNPDKYRNRLSKTERDILKFFNKKAKKEGRKDKDKKELKKAKKSLLSYLIYTEYKDEKDRFERFVESRTGRRYKLMVNRDLNSMRILIKHSLIIHMKVEIIM